MTHWLSDARRWTTKVVVAGCIALGCLAPVGAQTEQRVDVTIKGQAFVVKQAPVRLGLPTVIVIRNEGDRVRAEG